MTGLPLTQEEAHEIARAAIEAHDRAAAAEQALLLLVAALEASGIDVSLVSFDKLNREPGRGESYCRERVRQADAHTWGEEGITRSLERQREERERQKWAALRGDPTNLAYERAFQVEAQKLGGRVSPTGVVEWLTDFNDPTGEKRRQRAREAALAATNGGSK